MAKKAKKRPGYLDRAKEKSKERRKKGFWKPKEGTNLIRVLPPIEDGADPWYERFTHYGVRNHKGGILCRNRMLDENCFLCNMQAELEDSSLEEEQKYGKRIAAKGRVLLNIVDVATEATKDLGPQIYDAPYTVFDVLIAFYDAPDGDEDEIIDIVDPHNGYIVEIKREGTTMETTRYKTAIQIKKGNLVSGPLDDMDWLEDMQDLKEVAGKMLTNKEMRKIWEGLDDDDEQEDDDPPVEEEESAEDSDEGEEDEGQPDCFSEQFEEDDPADCDDCDYRKACKKAFKGDADDEEELGEPIESEEEDEDDDDLEAELRAAKKAGSKKKPSPKAKPKAKKPKK